MVYFRFLILLAVFCAAAASADVWKWTDVNGDTHYVSTNKAIFTWLDEDGKLHYSDTPDHKDAVAVQLVWVSAGTLEEVQSSTADSADEEYPAETRAQRAEREAAEAHYCKRATEIYDSYVNAPRLYKTNDEGEKEYLSDAAAETEIAETKVKMDELCS